MKRLPIFLIPLLLVGCSSGATTGNQPAPPSAAVQQQANATAQLAAEAKAKGTPLTDGNTLKFVFQGHSGEQVAISGGVNLTLTEQGSTGVYVGSVDVPDLDQAIVSYTITVNDQPVRDPWSHCAPVAANSPVVVFRGQKAAVPAELAVQPDHQTGQVVMTNFASTQLGESRRTWVYLPPGAAAGRSYPFLLAADGQLYFDGSVKLNVILDNLIAHKQIPPVIAVGVESKPDSRYAEFVADQPRFNNYQQFIGNELLPWVQSTYKVTMDRGGLVPLGFSNGGAWAFYTAVMNPNLVHRAILQSAIVPSVALPALPKGTRFYMTAGSLDPTATQMKDQLSSLLTKADNPVKVDEGVGGHDLALAETQLVKGLPWVFGN